MTERKCAASSADTKGSGVINIAKNNPCDLLSQIDTRGVSGFREHHVPAATESVLPLNGDLPMPKGVSVSPVIGQLSPRVLST